MFQMFQKFSGPILGSSSGIGQGTAIEFAKVGCKVVITGRKEEGIKETVQKCKDVGLPEDKVKKLFSDMQRNLSVNLIYISIIVE